MGEGDLLRILLVLVGLHYLDFMIYLFFSKSDQDKTAIYVQTRRNEYILSGENMRGRVTSAYNPTNVVPTITV